MSKKYEITGTCVVEVPTNRLIFVSHSPTKCKRVAKDLNSGKGFCGWTPDFILSPTLFGEIKA